MGFNWAVFPSQTIVAIFKPEFDIRTQHKGVPFDMDFLKQYCFSSVVTQN
jgi:hypothetical protein